MVLKCTLEELLIEMKQKTVICFGAGDCLRHSFFGEEYERYHFEDNIYAVIDNASSKQGTEIIVNNVSIPIISLEKMENIINENFMIIITSDYFEEIVQQLNMSEKMKNINSYIWLSVIDYYHENLEISQIIMANAKCPKKIPRTIHWCWFGEKELPEKEKYCLKSWQEYCSDYEMILWNEKNFDINSNIYVKEAYENKKYAFVSDYVRLWSIYNFGGIYMDTDVEVVKELDAFLGHSAFSGFQEKKLISTGIMGGEAGNEWFGYLLSYYDNRHFAIEYGLDLTPNVLSITTMTEKRYHLKLESGYIDINNIVTLYPQEVFCPKSYKTKEVNRTRNTHCIHWFSGSWGK